MVIVDINVLIYVVNKDADNHQPVLAWWRSVLSSGRPVGLCWTALSGFLRVVTNRRAIANPLSVADALATVDGWIDHPAVQLISESPDHWTIIRELISALGTAGNLTTDAHLAAIAIGNGASLASCDADFAKFKKLRWENPLAGAVN